MFLGRRITPLTRRRLDNFRANRRGFWSLWIFLALFLASLFAEFIANDRPLAGPLRRRVLFPGVRAIIRKPTFGGDFCRARPITATRRSSKLIEEKGWMVWPLIPFSYRTITDAAGPVPGARRRAPTGSAPTTRAATCWRG